MAVYCGMSHKNVTKVVWHILAQKSSLNNTMFMVSLLRIKSYGGQAGVSVQVSVSWFKGSTFRGSEVN
jgi:hypothetical protein